MLCGSPTVTGHNTLARLPQWYPEAGEPVLATVLADAAVRKYRPAKERREIRDGLAQGLYLVIQPSGSRSWAMRFRRPDGSPGKLTLGSVDLSGKEAQGEPVLGAPLTLTAARASSA